MNLESVDINILAALLGGLAYFALGALWYSPILFSDRWVRAAGIDMGDASTGGMPPVSTLIMGLIGAVAAALVIGLVYEWGGGDGLVDGLIVGAILGIGIVAMEGLKGIQYYGQTWELYVINRAYEILGFMLAGVVYALIDGM